MRKWKNDFKNQSNNEAWYDFEEDWELIASSLKTQYGYSIRKEIETSIPPILLRYKKKGK